ncbi:MAG: hypothetical protein NTW14_00080 [bacterium]|nr:hypothetical protein [bacterium]
MKKHHSRHLLFILVCGTVYLGCRSGAPGGNNGPDFQDPLITVSDTSLNFGSTAMERTLLVYNAGGGSLNWSLESGPAWICLNPSSGTLGYTENEPVTVELNRSLLETGNYADSILLNSNGGSRTIQIYTYKDSIPLLGELPDTLNFSALSDSLPLILSNAGSDTLNWTLSIDSVWFSATQYSGSTVWQTPLWVKLNRQTAPQSSLRAQLHLSSNGGDKLITLLANNSSTVGQWLSYSGAAEGYYSAQPNDFFFIVRFNRPAGWSTFKVSKVRLLLHTFTGIYDWIKLECWSVSFTQGNFWPNLNDLRYESVDVDPEQGYNDVTVDWLLTLDAFCVGYSEYDTSPDANPDPYYDSSNPVGRSYTYWYAGQYQYILDLMTTWEWCIEVFVEPVVTTDGQTGPGIWLKPSLELPPSSAVFNTTCGPGPMDRNGPNKGRIRPHDFNNVSFGFRTN